MSKFYQIIAAAPDLIYTAPDGWDYDIVAWAFEHGSALPIPVTALGPQVRKGAEVRNRDRERSGVVL